MNDQINSLLMVCMYILYILYVCMYQEKTHVSYVKLICIQYKAIKFCTSIQCFPTFGYADLLTVYCNRMLCFCDTLFQNAPCYVQIIQHYKLKLYASFMLHVAIS